MRLFATLCVVLLISAVTINAQTPEKKLKQLKGKVKSITVVTDSGTVTFEGKEAAKLHKKMKQKKEVRNFAYIAPPQMMWHGNSDCEEECEEECEGMCKKEMFKEFNFNFDMDDDSSGEKKRIIIINGDTVNMGDMNFKMIKPHKFKFDVDVDIDKDGDVDVEVQNNSDNKNAPAKKKKMKITVKDKNGETKTYTGEDAEKFLKENEGKENEDASWETKEGKKKIEKKVVIKQGDKANKDVK